MRPTPSIPLPSCAEYFRGSIPSCLLYLLQEVIHRTHSVLHWIVEAPSRDLLENAVSA